MNFNNYALGFEYLQFCELKNRALIYGDLDLSLISFFYPTLLLPLAIFYQENPGINVIPPANPDSRGYYEFIIDRLSEIEDGDCIDSHDGFAYLAGEFVDNVYDHSEFSSAYIMAQKYPTKKHLDISIIDNGISIPKNIEDAGHRYSDSHVLWQVAINGLSTKKEEGRGFGISGSIKLLTS